MSFQKQLFSSLLLWHIQFLTFLPAKCEHSSLCINLPGVEYKDEEFMSVGMENFPQNAELWSLLQEDKVRGALNKVLPLHLGKLDESPPKGLLNIYRIWNRQTNRTFNGWFRIEFEFKPDWANRDLHDSMKALILYVRDDLARRQNVGEFVWNFPTVSDAGSSCPDSDATKYMVISCGGASRSEPLVSNTIVLVRDDPQKDGGGKSLFPNSLKVVPNLRGRHKLNFYVRIPIQDCNQKRAIVIIDKYANPLNLKKKKDDVGIMTSTIWINDDSVPGIADPLPSPSGRKFLMCDKKLVDNQAVNLPWYVPNAGFRSTSYNAQNDDPGYLHGCQGHFFSGRCKHSFYEMVTSLYVAIGGEEADRRLRELSNQNVAHPNTIPICEFEPSQQRNVPDSRITSTFKYTAPKYYSQKQSASKSSQTKISTLEYLAKNAKPCNQSYHNEAGCKIEMESRPAPTGRSLRISGRASEMTLIGAYTRNLNANEDMYLGVRFEKKGFTRIVWGLRQGHGILMSIVVFFVLPVSMFMARYYKESFMKTRLLLTPVWYQVHVHAVCLTLGLLVGSLVLALFAKGYLGTSLSSSGTAHRTLGWICFVLFLLLCILGGFRGYDDPLRKTTIFLHWLFGTLCYILMLAQMVIAVFIPGSGVANGDQSHLMLDFKTADNEGFSNAACIHVFIWILFEITMHVIMMGNLIAFDRKMVVFERRMYLPVPIPVIKESTFEDADGHGLRVIVLIVYICCAFLSTMIYFIFNIMNTSWQGKGLGPMSCTHDENTMYMLDNIHPDCLRW